MLFFSQRGRKFGCLGYRFVNKLRRMFYFIFLEKNSSREIILVDCLLIAVVYKESLLLAFEKEISFVINAIFVTYYFVFTKKINFGPFFFFNKWIHSILYLHFYYFFYNWLEKLLKERLKECITFLFVKDDMMFLSRRYFL